VGISIFAYLTYHTVIGDSLCEPFPALPVKIFLERKLVLRIIQAEIENKNKTISVEVQDVE